MALIDRPLRGPARRRLEANQLKGQGLVELAEGLPYLTDLSLAHNSLEGAIGQIGTEGRAWQRFDLRSNALDYQSSDKDTKDVVRWPDSVRLLWNDLRFSQLDCESG